MIRLAHELDLLTAPYVFTDEEATAMADAGADVLVPHMGLTTRGSIGAHTGLTLDESVERVQALHDAARAVNPDILCLCHGGPIAEPDDAASRPREHHRGRRLLRRVEHGASADRDRDDREHEALQVDPDPGGVPMSGSRFIPKDDIVVDTFDWGQSGWVSRPELTGSRALCVMDVTIEPGGGHPFHRHPDQEEIIWVREGRVEQWLEDKKARAGPGRGGLHREGRRPRVLHARRRAGQAQRDPHARRPARAATRSSTSSKRSPGPRCDESSGAPAGRRRPPPGRRRRRGGRPAPRRGGAARAFAVDRVSIARLDARSRALRDRRRRRGAAAGARHVAAGEHVLVLRRGGRGPLVPRA